MVILPTDSPSFAWGVFIGAIAAFGTGFLQKAGEHLFIYLKNRINPKVPEPEQVDGRFVPAAFPPSECVWVNEGKLYDYEQKGYSYYPHPKNNARCFRLTSHGLHPLKEFLLVQPGAKEVASGTSD